MNPKQNPFSLYDFLGYFVPGASFLYGLRLLQLFAHPDWNLAGVFDHDLPTGSPIAYLFLVLLSYIVGHLLSFLSSITVEKYSLWQFGYPSKYLLGIATPKYYETKEHPVVRRIIRTVVAILLLPITIFDLVLGRVFHMRELYAQALDPMLITILKDKTREFIHRRFPNSEPPANTRAEASDFFRPIYHYALEHAEAHAAKMQNYVALYGFLRTFALIVTVFWWALAISFARADMQPLQEGFYLLAWAALAFITFMAFMKFYRRFSLEVLMALTAIFPRRDDT